MISITKFNINDKENVRVAFDIRTSVFVKEQKVDPTIEVDEFEKSAHHYLAWDGSNAVGAARWRKTENGIILERFAVVKPYRNAGIGKMLLQEVLADVLPLNETIYLHVQSPVISFYQKYGFEVDGEGFEEAGIKHFKMVWKKVVHFDKLSVSDE